jgi:hypothetical protein
MVLCHTACGAFALPSPRTGAQRVPVGLQAACSMRAGGCIFGAYEAEGGNSLAVFQGEVQAGAVG